MDRKQLPSPELSSDENEYAAPQTDMEVLIHGHISDVLGSRVNMEAGFLHNGGASLTAVLCVSKLRNEGLSVPSVIHLLTAATLREFSNCIEWADEDCDESKTEEDPCPSMDSNDNIGFICLCLAGFCQVVGVVTITLLAVGVPAAAVHHILQVGHELKAPASHILNIAGILLWAVLHLILVCIFKWLLIGKIRPGQHRIYSIYFVCWWIVQKLLGGFVTRVVCSLIRETPFLLWFYRGLGATIGSNCIISGTTRVDLPVLQDMDLIHMGDDVFIDQNCSVVGHDLRAGVLYLGRVEISSRSTLASSSVVMPGTQIARGVEVKPWSLMNCATVTEPGEVWRGSPARVLDDEAASLARPNRPAAMSFLIQSVGLIVIAGIFHMSFLLIGAAGALIHEHCSKHVAMALVIIIAQLPISFMFIITSVAMKWLLVGRSPKGEQSSSLYQEETSRFVDTLLLSVPLQYAGDLLLSPAISGPFYLWLLGAKIGAGSYVVYFEEQILRSTIDLLEIGENAVVGGGVILNMHQYVGLGVVEYAPVVVGPHCTLGNCLLLNPGVVMEAYSTIGTLSSVISHQCVPPQSTWLGNPAVLCGITREDDEEQTLLLQELVHGDKALDQTIGEANFIVVALVMVLTPILAMLLTGVLIAGVYIVSDNMMIKCTDDKSRDCQVPMVAEFAIVVVHTIVLFAAELLLAAGLKRFVFRRFEGRSPIWGYAFLGWLIWQQLLDTLHTTVLTWLQGTPFMPPYLRLLGGIVGDRCYYDSAIPSEVDCLTMGDDCVVLGSSQSFVPHTLDRGMLQFAPIKLGDRCSLGFASCLLPFSELENNSTLGPQSVGLKSEVLPAGKYGVGCPMVVFERRPATEYTEEDTCTTRRLSDIDRDSCCAQLCQLWAARGGIDATEGEATPLIDLSVRQPTQQNYLGTLELQR